MSTSRYQVLSRLATGGMGSVYVGRSTAELGVSRLVALKRPHPFILADPKLRRRVIDEARTASAIHHANVVAVVDVELVGGEPMLVLEYIEGATLSELVRNAASTTTYELFAPVAVRILLDTARGLGAAHALAILHRDVTPQNVLVGSDGVARLSDFGIAKSTAEGAEPTVSGSIKGKLGYLAPEVLDGREFVRGADLFALAIVAWEALTLQRLFGGGSDAETIARLIALERPPLATVAPALAAFDALFARALARELQARPASVAAFANELEAIAVRTCGVASPSDVAAYVETAFGLELRARRTELEATRARPVEEIDHLPLRPPHPRDDVETMSVGAVLTPEAATPPRHRRGVVVAFVATLLVIGVVVFARGRRMPSAPSAPPPAASEPAELLPPVAPASEVPVASAEPAPSAVESARPPPRQRPVPRAPVPKQAPTSATAFPTHAPPNPYAH